MTAELSPLCHKGHYLGCISLTYGKKAACKPEKQHQIRPKQKLVEKWGGKVKDIILLQEAAFLPLFSKGYIAL